MSSGHAYSACLRNWSYAMRVSLGLKVSCTCPSAHVATCQPNCLHRPPAQGVNRRPSCLHAATLHCTNVAYTAAARFVSKVKLMVVSVKKELRAMISWPARPMFDALSHFCWKWTKIPSKSLIFPLYLLSLLKGVKILQMSLLLILYSNKCQQNSTLFSKIPRLGILIRTAGL